MEFLQNRLPCDLTTLTCYHPTKNSFIKTHTEHLCFFFFFFFFLGGGGGEGGGGGRGFYFKLS